MAAARGIVARMEETVAGLTPHHRVHGLGMRMRLEAAVGDWKTLRGLTQRVEDAVEANLATPCPFNVGVLLFAAHGALQGGDEAGAARLVTKADAIGMVGYGRFHSARWLALAIARKDREETRRLVNSVERDWLAPGAWELWAALLEALALLGDRDRIEAEAPQWVRPDAYVAPFAVRALGVVRADRALLADAIDRFEAMGLAWHAQETRLLVGGV
jgi:sugar phosphate isomerase/epimerase